MCSLPEEQEEILKIGNLIIYSIYKIKHIGDSYFAVFGRKGTMFLSKETLESFSLQINDKMILCLNQKNYLH